MAFPIAVLNPLSYPAVPARRVTLVRFTRATTGPADGAAPDFDFRGFVSDKGPVAGLIGAAATNPAREFRIQVMRDRVDASAPLFASVENAALVAITHPQPGQALNPRTADGRQADCIYLRAASDGAGDPATKLKIHYGTATGPVIAELGLTVFAPREIFVQAHKVIINGPPDPSTPAAAACTFADDQFPRLIEKLNTIYAQVGVRFVLRGTILEDTVNGFTEQGTVTLSATADQRNTELQRILNTNPEPDSLNMYVFNQYRDITQAPGDDLGVGGIAFSRDDANDHAPSGSFPGCQAGITLRTFTDLQQMANIAAHEIGHSLRLIHYAARQGADVLYEIYASRNLMLNTFNILGGNPQAEIGYGAYDDGMLQQGTQLGVKSIATDRHLAQSNQARILRAAIARDSYKPVRRGRP